MSKSTYEMLEQKVQRLEAEMAIIKRTAPEQAFSELKWQWQTTFDSVGASICVLTPNWEILQCNKATSNLLHKSCEDIIGHKCFELVHGTDVPHEHCPVTVLEKTKKRAVEVLQLGDRWVEVVADPILGENDELKAIVHIISDITELRRNEQRFRALAELLPQTVFEMDKDGRLTFVNTKALKNFGYSHEEFQKGLNGLDMLVPENREAAKASINALLQGNASYEGIRFTALKKDGSTFPVLVYASADIDELGQMGVRGIVIDISEQEKLADEKNQLEKQYIQAQKMEAIGRLAGGVAHDLNNMLSPIVGYGELLLELMPPDSPNRKAAERIFSAGLRARDMVQQLLAFSRKQALEIKTIDINQVIIGFKELLERILRDDIDLEVKLPNNVPSIQADAGQIEQVIMNLAVNAQDAMPEGGKITIEVDVVELSDLDIQNHEVPSAGQYVVFSFSDTGHGMDKEIKDRIFDPFFTTKCQGKGTGLGLATVYGIIKQHNGNIRVYSEPGKGSTFRIYFPGTENGSKQVAGNSVRTEDLFGTESILVVEDNDVVRELAASILEKYGYQPVLVSGITQCRKLLMENRTFDLLLTDVILQDTNGKELYNYVKSVCPDIKVIYMSGYTGDIIVHHGVLEEGISFIQKPFSYRDLLLKVRERLDKIEILPSAS